MTHRHTGGTQPRAKDARSHQQLKRKEGSTPRTWGDSMALLTP